ncbi:MAG: ABC transporter permease subunit [Planctomycetota bacterium]
MINKLLTIAKNTFTETLRQPVYAVIIVATVLIFIISPSLTMFTLKDDNKLLQEIGLSTLFLAGLFIAIFTASKAVSEEIESKTISTVLAKPVQRPVFIIGKFFGVTAALVLEHYICSIALLMMLRHGVLESASDTHDWTVISAGGVCILITVFLTAFLNYFYDWKFSSTAIVTGAVTVTVAIVFLYFIDRNWRFNPAGNAISIFNVYGSILLLLGLVIFVAVAVALSTRFNIIVTLTFCIGIFLLGLVNDYLFGRFADVYMWAKIGRAILPNLQVFWISDAIYEGSEIPSKYLLISTSYAACYATGIIFLSIALFQRRQVG